LCFVSKPLCIVPTLIASGVGVLIGAWLLLLLAFGSSLHALWREAVLRRPILIFESDDWGPAPPPHAHALEEIAEVLGEFRDATGCHPVMTIGVVLAIPAGGGADRGMAEEIILSDERFAPLVRAMRAGVEGGVFALHLHGRSHYWRDALAKAGDAHPYVARWLAGPETWRSEDLPAGIQSRWAPELNGATFPITRDAARAAAEDEGRLFAACFGAPATVAVPTTFVWNDAVERGWADAGIRVVVTPGRYYRHRGQLADPSSAPMITNGMRSGSLTYVVRDRYFEPYKGHSAEEGLRALGQNEALGRPTLLETHRINYLDPDLRDRSLAAIRSLLSRALARYPNLRFLSTAELAAALEERSPELVDDSMRGKLAAWCARVRTLPRFWRLARLTGLGFLIAGVQRLSTTT
jgi:hypothetical protein